MPGRKLNKTSGNAEERAAQRDAMKAAKREAYAAAKKLMKGQSIIKVKKPRTKSRKHETVLDGRVVNRARGTLSDEATVDAILEMVSSGALLRDACKEIGLSKSQWDQWRREDRFNMQKRYDQAKRDRTEAWADHVIAMVEKVKFADEVPAAKLKAEVYRWFMGKHNPEYSDKNTVVHEGNPDAPIHQITSEMTDEQAAAYWEATLKSKGTQFKKSED